METAIDISRISFRPVDSSWIAGISYIPCKPEHRVKGVADGMIAMELKSGEVWVYPVASWRFGLMLAGKSIGQQFHKLIRKAGIQGMKIKEGVKRAA